VIHKSECIAQDTVCCCIWRRR